MKFLANFSLYDFHRALEYFLDVEKLNLSAIRTVRVLRPLRAINRIPSMRILVRDSSVNRLPCNTGWPKSAWYQVAKGGRICWSGRYVYLYQLKPARIGNFLHLQMTIRSTKNKQMNIFKCISQK